MTTTYQLAGLTCNGCVQRVTAALRPWADAVEVTLDPPRATLTGPRGGLADLQAAVAGAGGHYTLSPLAVPAAPTSAPAPAANANANAGTGEAAPGWFATYRPLLLILAYVLGGSLLVQVGTGTPVGAHETMRFFMAGFFLVFSFFKLLDVEAFADAYAGYDLLAARWHGWGRVYPFVELALGVAYLANWQPALTSGVTLAVMGFSAIGVVQAVTNRRQIRCACLGAVFNLPMSTVTIVEDVGMVVMALLMLTVLA